MDQDLAHADVFEAALHTDPPKAKEMLSFIAEASSVFFSFPSFGNNRCLHLLSTATGLIVVPIWDWDDEIAQDVCPAKAWLKTVSTYPSVPGASQRLNFLPCLGHWASLVFGYHCFSSAGGFAYGTSGCSAGGNRKRFCAAAFFVHRLHRRLVWLGPEGVTVRRGSVLAGRTLGVGPRSKKVSVSPAAATVVFHAANGVKISSLPQRGRANHRISPPFFSAVCAPWWTSTSCAV